MNRLNFIKIVALTAISSTILGNSVSALSNHKIDLIIPNVCHNHTFNIDFDKHNVVISGIDKTNVYWRGCIFNLKNIPEGYSVIASLSHNFTDGCITECRFDCVDNSVKYKIKTK